MSNVQAVGGDAQTSASTPFCSKLYEIAKIAAQIAIRVLFVVTHVLISASLFPAAWHVVVIPLAAVSSAFVSGFFFSKQELLPKPLFPHPGVLLRPARTDGRMPETFTAHAPVGYTRLDQNCAFNALAHALDNPPLAEWLRTPIPTDLVGFQRFLNEYNPPASLVQQFNDYATARPGQPILDLFLQFLEQRPYLSIQDTFRNLRALHGPFREFYGASDAAAAARESVSRGSSQNLRLAISQVNQGISPNPREATDLGELLSSVLLMLPDAFKLKMGETIYRRVDGALVPDPPVPIMDLPYIPLTLDPNDPAPTLERLFQAHSTHEYTEPSNEGAESVSRTFLEPPPALWFQIKRFKYEWVAPEANWGRWLSSFFRTPSPQAPELRISKNDTPVECPEEITIRLQNGEERRYRLACFQRHHGDYKGGHYVSAQIRDGRKYLANDALVTLVESPEDQERWNEWLRQSYLLCYVPT